MKYIAKHNGVTIQEFSTMEDALKFKIETERLLSDPDRIYYVDIETK